MSTVILKIVYGGKHARIISNPDVSESIPTETGDIIGVITRSLEGVSKLLGNYS